MRVPAWAMSFCRLVTILGVCGCQQTSAHRSGAVSGGDADLRLPQIEGTLQVPGLEDRVKVIRDRSGIPHIYASNADDLFFAQGFVQAQDRLFQIDLWRRSVQGRLAEILGPDFVERDRLARLMRYRGDMAAEWASYAADARQIVGRFVEGINAWVVIARKNPPVEFDRAGYEPELWKPEDLLSRAEGFTMGANALGEVFRSRLTALVGLERSAQLLPPQPAIDIRVPSGVDLTIIDKRLQDELSTIGAVARFGQPHQAAADRARPSGQEGSNNWVVSGKKSETGRPLLANDPHRRLDHPSLRYLVHLNAPGWNVIGAVQPYLPGVSVGHNDRIAWGLTVFGTDVQDLYIEKLNPDNPHQYQYQGTWVDVEIRKDRIGVKGRPDPVDVEHQYTRHGPVIAVDGKRHEAVVMRWTGDEPGTVGYLGDLSLDRARSWTEFRAALTRHKMPAENFVYADVDGNIGYQAAGLSPIRKNWSGLLPVPGWTGEYEWTGWYSLDDLPHAHNPSEAFLATANDNTLPPGEKRVIGFEWSDPARINRIREVLTSRDEFGIHEFEQLQHDATAWNAEQIVPLLSRVKAEAPEIERVRRLLVGWDMNIARASAAATVYVIWEKKLLEGLIKGRLDGAMAAEYLTRGGDVLVPALTSQTAAWFGVGGATGRDTLLLTALSDTVAQLESKQGEDISRWTWGSLHAATFRHALAVDGEGIKLFNVGPIPRAGYAETPLMTAGPGFDQAVGATFREIVDVGNWDGSVATSAPGQSGQPGSRHFSDLAKLWGEEQYFSLPFSSAAIEASAEATLMLTPKP